MSTRQSQAWFQTSWGRTQECTRCAAGSPVSNLVLLQIPDDEFSVLQPYLESFVFENAARLEPKSRRIEAVYFLNRGIGSMLVETADGRSVEVGVIGREDMIGLPVAAGFDEFTSSVVMQVPGDGLRLPTSALERVLPELPELKALLLRRLAIRSVGLAQNAACNRLHTIKQRLTRWLLLTHDRMDSDVIHTTHDFLSKMVGTDRATVTLALEELERAGATRHGRGSIAIEDRPELEKHACECYALLRRFNAELGLRT